MTRMIYKYVACGCSWKAPYNIGIVWPLGITKNRERLIRRAGLVINSETQELWIG